MELWQQRAPPSYSVYKSTLYEDGAVSWKPTAQGLSDD